jgi:hypothetical protein
MAHAHLSHVKGRYLAEREDWWATIEADGLRVYVVDWFGWA